MNIFDLRERVVEEYGAYVKSFLRIDDAQIDAFVHAALRGGRLWPDPLVQLNPAFEPGDTVEELARDGVLHPECGRIFRRNKDAHGFGESIRLHRHQQDAIAASQRGGSYVLTTGTGSGKSLAYVYSLDPRDLTDRELEDILDPAEDPPDAPRTTSFPGETFRVLKEREIKEHGEYRTQRLVLAAWDRGAGTRPDPEGSWQEPGPNGPWQASGPIGA